MRRSRPLSHIGGFALSAIVSGASSAVSIPILVSAIGPTTWASLALGQSVGLLASVVVGYGWAITGAASVAGLDERGASDMLWKASVTRGALLAPVALVAFIAAFFASPHSGVDAGLSAIAFSINGLAATWFYVGRQAPYAFVVRDAVPRALGVLGGSLLVAATHLIWVFPFAIAVAGTVAFVRTVHFGVLREHQSVTWHLILSDLRSQLPIASAAIISAGYLNSPIIFVGVFAPTQLATFALVDRTFRIANAATNPITQYLQGWIPRPRSGEGLDTRIKRGTKAAAVLAVGASISFILGCPLAASLLTAGRIGIETPASVFFAITLGATTISQVVGISGLVALGKSRAVAHSALLGAALGLPALVPGTILLGAAGAAGAQACAEVAVSLFQLMVLRRTLSGGRGTAREAG